MKWIIKRHLAYQFHPVFFRFEGTEEDVKQVIAHRDRDPWFAGNEKTEHTYISLDAWYNKLQEAKIKL